MDAKSLRPAPFGFPPSVELPRPDPAAIMRELLESRGRRARCCDMDEGVGKFLSTYCGSWSDCCKMLTARASRPNTSDMASESTSLTRYVHLLTGRPASEATGRDWLGALAALVRERIGEQWARSAEAPRPADVKRVCYLSMEFLPGCLLAHALRSFGLDETCRR